MSSGQPHLDANRASWNARTAVHLESDFYDLPSFKAGRNSLTPLEQELLAEVSGKSLLHLQCHFGQDTLSLVRMGADVTGVDLSDVAIAEAKKLAGELGLKAHFICCDVLQLDRHLDGQFDLVFTSFGTIGWLPELVTWGRLIHRYLKPGGTLVFAEFHPVVWMMDEHWNEIRYPYFNRGPIVEPTGQTYTDGDVFIEGESWGWNHSLGDVFSAVLEAGLQLTYFQEYDYSPFDIFPETTPVKGGYQIRNLEGKVPLMYALKAVRPQQPEDSRPITGL